MCYRAVVLTNINRNLKEPLKETSVIHRIFGGRERQQIKCRSCSYISNTYQPILDIPLEIRRGGSIEEALTKHFASCQLTKAKGNAYNCDQCKKQVDAVKRTLIYDAPEHATLHLKRFDFTFRGTSKIHDFIRYPKVLDLTSYTTRQELLIYKLLSVIVHQGRRASSGHYYAFCKQPNGTWSSYNDELVDQVGEKTALNQEAYILVYARDRSTSYDKFSNSATYKQLHKHNEKRRISDIAEDKLVRTASSNGNPPSKKFKGADTLNGDYSSHRLENGQRSPRTLNDHSPLTRKSSISKSKMYSQSNDEKDEDLGESISRVPVNGSSF